MCERATEYVELYLIEKKIWFDLLIDIENKMHPKNMLNKPLKKSINMNLHHVFMITVMKLELSRISFQTIHNLMVELN